MSTQIAYHHDVAALSENVFVPLYPGDGSTGRFTAARKALDLYADELQAVGYVGESEQVRAVLRNPDAYGAVLYAQSPGETWSDGQTKLLELAREVARHRADKDVADWKDAWGALTTSAERATAPYEPSAERATAPYEPSAEPQLETESDE